MSHKRDLLALDQLSTAELLGLVRRASELKEIHKLGGRIQPLMGKTLAMIFEKSSTRTRVSFDVGMYQLGGHALMLKKDDIQIGRGETIADTAQVLSRYVDGIMIRTFEHKTLTTLAAHATVPVINGLTDWLHPCQILADLQTCREVLGDDCLQNMHVAWIGDGNNMAHSWIKAAQVLGFSIALACPEGYDPDPKVVADARAAGGKVSLYRDAHAAAAGAQMVTTDVWASMGQESEQKIREAAFAKFQVNTAVMDQAAPEGIFLHCLPAHRGEEVSAAVIDGPRSYIFDEAENRLHAQKAVLEWLLGGRSPAA